MALHSLATDLSLHVGCELSACVYHQGLQTSLAGSCHAAKHATLDAQASLTLTLSGRAAWHTHICPLPTGCLGTAKPQKELRCHLQCLS